VSAPPLPPLPPFPRSDWAYFFDIDGTLIDFADTPSSVQVSDEVRRLLERLYQCAGGAVALMSGRTIAEVDRLFPAVQLPVAGQHGVERRNAAGVYSRHAAPTERFERARERLTAAIADKPGLLLEDKGVSLALHYRRVPELADFVQRTMEEVLPQLAGQYSLQAGKSVVEMKPAGKDKGLAVREFLEEPPFMDRAPVFVGDDDTDEYGFLVVNQLGGHSIKVGVGATAARWRLPDVEAVRQWLRSI
jgi:trehalose 6-phosphate phosphatase